MRYGILLIAFVFAACGQVATTQNGDQTSDISGAEDSSVEDAGTATGVDGGVDVITTEDTSSTIDTSGVTGADNGGKDDIATPPVDVPAKDLCESVKCPEVDELCIKARTCDPATGDCTVLVPDEAGAVCEPDDNPCTAHVCDGQGACVASDKSLVGESCDDKSECSMNDICKKVGEAIKCIGDAIDVNDNNPCTFDACVKGKLMHTPINGATCNPENECAGSGVCSKGECIKNKKCACDADDDCEQIGGCAPVMFCDKSGEIPKCVPKEGSGTACATGNNQCGEVQCNPATGTCDPIPANEGGTCDDKNGCTSNDKCVFGVCKGTEKDCNDSNPCTADSCVADKCLNAPLNGTKCTGGKCEAGICKPDTVNNPCETGECTSLPLPAYPLDLDVGDNGFFVVTLKPDTAHCYGPGKDKIGEVTPVFSLSPYKDYHYVSVVDGTNHFALVMRTLSGGVNAHHIRFFSPDCTPLGPKEKILPYGGESIDIQSTADGIHHIIWEGKSKVLMWRRYDAAGTNLGPDVSLPGLGDYGHLALNKLTGDGVLTGQDNKTKPVNFQRFNSDGELIDLQPVAVAGSAGGNSGYYDAHSVGMNTNGEFVILWTQYNTKSYMAAYYDANAKLSKQLKVGSITTGMKFYDSTRSAHVMVETPDTNFLLPAGHKENKQYLYATDATGKLLKTQESISMRFMKLRIDAAGNNFILQRQSSLYYKKAVYFNSVVPY